VGGGGCCGGAVQAAIQTSTAPAMSERASKRMRDDMMAPDGARDYSAHGRGAVLACAAGLVWAAAAVLPAQQPGIALPVERASNVFFVRVQIDGRGPFWFTVDTGATLTVIDPAAAARAGLAVRPAGRRPNVGVGEGETHLSTTTARLQIEGLADFAPPFFYVMPVREAASVLGHAIDGVLGTDVLRGYVVEFDYGASRVTLTPPGGGPAAADGVPIAVGGNVLLAPATLGLPDGSRVMARLLIDTGSNGSLTLTSPFVTAHRLDSRFASTRASMAMGVNGVTVSRVIQLESIGMGAAIVRAPDAALSRAVAGLHASADFDGILGAELLRQFRLVIDYPRRRLQLLPVQMQAGLEGPGRHP
jgi:predicted aspartyl protease